jgi:hypothetical protein
MAFVKNKRAFFAALKAADGEARRKFHLRVNSVLYTMEAEILSLTPVWSGSAVANFQWSAGAPRVAFIDPVDNGPPGHTNAMPLGPEPRRAPNEVVSMTSLEMLDTSNPFQMFWLTNNDPDIGGLEMGELPGAPLQSRSPNGMMRLSIEFVMAKMAAGQM